MMLFVVCAWMLFTAYFCTNYSRSVVKVDTGALWFLFVCLWASLGLIQMTFCSALSLFSTLMTIVLLCTMITLMHNYSILHQPSVLCNHCTVNFLVYWHFKWQNATKSRSQISFWSWLSEDLKIIISSFCLDLTLMLWKM